MAKKNLIVGQSGGPTAVINSSLYGVVSEGLSHPDTIEHVYGMINGIEGFLNDCILDFEEALPGEDLNGLNQLRAPILVPVVTSFRNLWRIRSTRLFLKNLKN